VEGARAGGRGAGGKSLRARIGRRCGQARAPGGHSTNAAGDDWLEWARIDGRGRELMCEARTRRARAGRKGR
jgi:hypothetical protein